MTNNSIFGSSPIIEGKKRFLNLEFNRTPARINIVQNGVPMDDISEVQDIIKEKYGLTVGSAYLQIWNENVTPHTQLRVFNHIKTLPEQYFWDESQPGFLCLSVQLDSTPIQSTNSELRGDTFTSSINVKRKRTEAIPPVPTAGVCNEAGWLRFVSSHEVDLLSRHFFHYNANLL